MSVKNKSPGYRELALKIEKFYKPLRENTFDRQSNLTGQPTIEDFVNFLVGKGPFKGYFDPHWTSFWNKCSPCINRYDVIVKLETIEDDVAYLRNKLNITAPYKEVFMPIKLKKTMEHCELLKEVPQKLLEKLWRKYEADFGLFGYSLPSWFTGTCENQSKTRFEFIKSLT